MIYDTPETSAPSIFLLETHTLKWHFLADTFAEYQRMTIAHLGLPYWELCFSGCALPSWTEQLFLLLAPNLLAKNQPLRPGRSLANHLPAPPYNALDPAVFRTKPKCSASAGGGGVGGGGLVGSVRPVLAKNKNHF